MKITKVYIENFRNLTEVSVRLMGVTAIIGNNNSGKSNFLRALTLPLLSEEIGTSSKNLSWTDIGNESKNKYYEFIESNKDALSKGKVELSMFEAIIPKITVTIEFTVEDSESYSMKDFAVSFSETGEAQYQLSYSFTCKNSKELMEHVAEVINNTDSGNSLEELKLNLLPVSLYTYAIYVPFKEKNLSYDNLKLLKYNSIQAERDEFSNSNTRLGSKQLVQLLNKKLSTSSMIKIESEYTNFFEQIKSLSGMDEVLNWQENTEIKNAQDFFSKISILPNMPPMTSLLNSVRLGYDESSLASQGLGYRNLILQLVMINSLIEASNSLYSLLTVEEPEAHLCYENQQIMNSFILNIASGNKDLQLVYSTHSLQFLDKLDLKNIVLINEGKGYAFIEEFTSNELNYLSKNPNLDLFKLFYSSRCILVEGISEELLIKSYIKNKHNTLSNIEIISFHKGFKKIIDIWLKINIHTNNKLGIIRDFDNQPRAQEEHEAYNSYDNIFVKTTVNYTLEDDIVMQGNNFSILKKYFEAMYGWSNIETPELLSKKWKSAKAEIMLQFCVDIGNEELSNVELPQHIALVLNSLEIV
ncbi:ATP-dependent nuclease [Desemzia sp. FAM 23989]|uniref:ATP-dependent nuclease n=1 Tax=Desemzia sp. FAM 23989 TaxID=3259523 RepID=UPI0038868C61